MHVVLQILGGIVLLLLLLVGTLVLLARRAMRKAAGDSDAAPPRIHLVRDASPDWLEEPAVAAALEPLAAAGFQDGGVYAVREMAGAGIQALANPKSGTCGAVYRHPTDGVWVDLFARYQDGTSITFTSAPHGSDQEHRPGHGRASAPGLDSLSLYSRFLAERPDRPLLPAAAEEVSALIERNYAEEMAWRRGRGRITDGRNDAQSKRDTG